jgi:hypothetical protein
MICIDCKQDWPSDRFNDQSGWPESCFRCRSKGISLALQGGKEYWNADTESRRRETAISEAKSAGLDPVPVHSKGWSSASPSSIAKTGEISKKVGAFGAKPTG